MAYSPTMADMNSVDNEGVSSSSQSYSPTLADMNAVDSESSAKSSPSFLNSALQTLGNYFEGSSSGALNTITSGLNLIPRTAYGITNAITGAGTQPWLIPQAHWGTGEAANLGNLAGNLGGFLAGGEGLDAARGFAEGLPYAGQLASALGGSGASGIVRRAIGSGISGAAQNPNTPITGATNNAALSVGLDTLGATGNAIGAGITRLWRPQVQAQNIMSQLSGGRSIEGNAISLANDIKNSYQTQQNAASALYNPISEQYGDSNIYSHLNPSNPINLKINPDTLNTLSPDARPLYKRFINNPTFNNAHDLQSQIGFNIRDYGSQGLSTADQDRIGQLNNIRQNVLSNMRDFLSNQNPADADAYDHASNFYLNNVVPYKTNNIAPIANGTITNPGNTSISNIFKNPNENTNTIFSHLAPDAQNKILYSQIGKINPSKVTPSTINNSFESLPKGGFESYINPGLQEQIRNMNSASKNISDSQHGAGLIAGILAAAHLGPEAGAVGEGLGAMLGSKLVPALAKGSGYLVPQFLRKGVSAVSPLVRPALQSNNFATGVLGTSYPQSIYNSIAGNPNGN